MESPNIVGACHEGQGRHLYLEKKMHIEIRDYRGVERADIELNRIALVAGRNEQGKTCVVEAARAALCGMAIPIADVLKKDAKLLVRDGADAGSARVLVGNCAQAVRWPSATIVRELDEGMPPDRVPGLKCSDYASGFLHLLDWGPSQRANVLGTYIETAPTQKEVEAAAKDAGYQDAAVAKIWESLQGDGWDATYRRARDYTVKLKGQWQEVTREKYGAKKGADWKRDLLDFDRETLVEKASVAEQAVLNMAGAVAVSDTEIERLKRQVRAANDTENRIKLNDQLDPLRTQLQESQNERQTLPDDPAEVPPMPKAACPECGVVLVFEYPEKGPLSLKAYVTEDTPKVLGAKILERRAAVDTRIEGLKADITEIEGRITTVGNLIATAEAAEKRLDEIAKAPKLDEVAMQTVKDELSHAQACVLAFDAKARADKLHGDLVKNEKLLAILAPDGLRRRKLATKLDEFNARLATICASAAWPVVRLDEKLEGHYGTRPIWAASKSGQWRARTVLQIALAQIDGSAAVLLDEADMLDTRGRNGLFNALKASGLRAIVCMTFSKREKVPDLAALGDGFGRSYWIDGGKTEAIS